MQVSRPQIAAATLWYEFYYDVILNGGYNFKIRELHKQYGPIIRVSPYELHINDPDYFDVLYSNNLPVNKSRWYLSQFDLGFTTFATIDHKHHRLRRSALNPFFSKQMINRLGPMMQSIIDKFCYRLGEFSGTGQPVEMRAAYSALTIDIITAYAFNESGAISMRLISREIDTRVYMALPQSFVSSLSSTFSMIFLYENRIKAQTERVLAGTYKPGKGAVGSGLDTTIMHALLQSDLPPEERSGVRIWNEGMSVVGAGSETSANVLATLHFHLLDNPDLLAKLRAELKEALPDKDATIMLSTVERLPYLNAVINEALRLSFGVITRLGRTHPTSSMRYKDWVIPAGTSVGMSPMLVNLNETIFPYPEKFSPERWLERGKQLDKYMASFSRGTRMCIGINLAKAELYLTVAALFRRFDDMELFETTKRDVEPKHDHFIAHPVMDSKGVRVIYK